MSYEYMTGLSTLVNGIAQSEAMRIQGQYYQKIAEMNARFAEMEARDVIKSGAREASEHGKTINKMVGAQRANYAAQGVEVDTGTAADVQQQTREIGYAEQREIRNNAWRKAFGLKAEAAFGRLAGKMQRNQANFNSRNTLVTAGLRSAGSLSSAYAKNDNNTIETPTVEKREPFDPASYKGRYSINARGPSLDKRNI